VLDTITALNALGGGTVGGMQCDVSRYEEVHALFEYVAERFGGTDILINNAAVPQRGKLTEMMPFPEEWDYTIGINLTGAAYCCHEAIPHMLRRGGGWIINISSISAEAPTGKNVAYVAGKAGLLAFSVALMDEVRGQGIRVGTVLPGMVNSPLCAPLPVEKGWMLQPEDIASTVMAMLTAPVHVIPSKVELHATRRIE
jgi:3-oxoacyl-[acyl-carrier protein] reductase